MFLISLQSTSSSEHGYRNARASPFSDFVHGQNTAILNKSATQPLRGPASFLTGARIGVWDLETAWKFFLKERLGKIRIIHISSVPAQQSSA